MPPMRQEVVLDVRGLEAPEPLELALDSLAALAGRQCLCLLIDREPWPLYAMLDSRGYSHEVAAHDGDGYEIRIWSKA